MRRLHITFGILVLAALSACAQSPTDAPTAAPSSTPPAISVPPTVSGSAEECPSATPGTLALRNDDDGYCLLYLEGYTVVVPFAGEICLVPGEPGLACHNMHVMIEVSGAEGRSAGQVADALVAEFTELTIPRSTLTIAGEEVAVLDNYPGVDILRLVLIVHDDRLYRLTFMRGFEAGSEDMARADVLYTTLIDSFTFLPAE